MRDVYKQIRSASPDARVLVIGYPKLFRVTVINNCAGLEKADQRWVNEKVRQLNDVIEEAAKAVGFEYVDIEDSFDGHYLCEILGRDEWINDRDLSDKEHSFHPNAAGQAKMAEVTLARLRQVRPGRIQTIFPSQTVTTTTTVGPGQRRASFFAWWPGSDVPMSLRAPSGRTIARGTTDPDVDHLLGPTFELYVVENPEPGDWTVDLSGADVSADGEEVGLLVEQTAPLNEIRRGLTALFWSNVRPYGLFELDMDRHLDFDLAATA